MEVLIIINILYKYFFIKIKSESSLMMKFIKLCKMLHKYYVSINNLIFFSLSLYRMLFFLFIILCYMSYIIVKNISILNIKLVETIHY